MHRATIKFLCQWKSPYQYVCAYICSYTVWAGCNLTVCDELTCLHVITQLMACPHLYHYQSGVMAVMDMVIIFIYVYPICAGHVLNMYIFILEMGFDKFVWDTTSWSIIKNMLSNIYVPLYYVLCHTYQMICWGQW